MECGRNPTPVGVRGQQRHLAVSAQRGQQHSARLLLAYDPLTPWNQPSSTSERRAAGTHEFAAAAGLEGRVHEQNVE